MAAGDAVAFDALLGRHVDAIFAYLLRLTGSHADAEDLTQETFLRVWRKAAAYEPGRVKAGTWLHTIAHNLCMDSFRRRRELPLPTATPEEPDPLADPERLASASEEQRRLESAIARLPDNQRAAILLCQVQGFSNAQAAEVLGIGTRALESLLARARRTLRAHLSEPAGGNPKGQ